MKLKEMSNEELVKTLTERAFKVANYKSNKSKYTDLERAEKEVLRRLNKAD